MKEPQGLALQVSIMEGCIQRVLAQVKKRWSISTSYISPFKLFKGYYLINPTHQWIDRQGIAPTTVYLVFEWSPRKWYWVDAQNPFGVINGPYLRRLDAIATANEHDNRKAKKEHGINSTSTETGPE